MKRKTRIVIISMLITQLLLSAGCWSSKEVETLALVTLMGIDYRNENGQDIWKASALVLTSLGQGQGEQAGRQGEESYFEGEGPTLQDAILDFSLKMSKTPFYGYISGYIIGENAAREKMTHVIESSGRYWQTRPRNIYFLARPEASEVLKAGGSLEPQLSKELTDFAIYRATATGQSIGIYQYELEGMLQSSDRDAVLGVIQPAADPDAYNKAETNQNSSQSGSQAGNQRGNTKDTNGENQHRGNIVEGIGVFRDDKLVGYLNREETEGCILLTRKLTKGQMTIVVEKDDQLFTYFLSGSKCKIKPIVQGDKISFQAIIQTAGGVNDHPGFTLGVKEIKELEQVIGERIKSMATATIEKAKEYDADFLGFSEKLHRSYPKVWKTLEGDWRQAFLNADIEVIVKAKIVTTGKIGDKMEINRASE